MKYIIILSLIIMTTSCSYGPLNIPDNFDLQGHRGCRGLMPENTIPAFLHALDLGVMTLELDLVISKDFQVVVSHEPFFSPEICRDKNGKPIEDFTKERYNIFEYNYDEISQFDCGSEPHSRFPDQKKIPVAKPLLSDLIVQAEAHAKKMGRPAPYYNMEIKRNPEWDGKFHPGAQDYAALVLRVINDGGIKSRSVIQSFDMKSLQVVREVDPTVALAYLTQLPGGLDDQLARLGLYQNISVPISFGLTRKRWIGATSGE